MSFSLRDYTDKMRTINAFECWPFEMKEDLTQEKINSMLPPMAIPNNSPRFVSQNDVLRRRSPQHSDKRNSNKTIPDANNVASTSREKLLSRSKLRRRSIAEIFDRNKNDEKQQSSQSLMAMSLPLPMSTTPNYPSMPPPSPQPVKDLHLPPSSSFQIGNLLNVIVLEDNEEEDEQMVSKFLRSKRLEALRSEPESLNKILTMASETNAAGDREDEMESEFDAKVKEVNATKEDSAKLKLPSPVIRKIAVHNFLKSCAKQENSKQLVKKSKPGPEEIQCHVQVPSTFEKDFSGNDEETANLKAKTNDENIGMNIHKRKEVSPIVENKEFSNASEEVVVKNIMKSKQPVKKCKSLFKVSFSDNNLMQFDKGDTAHVVKPESSQPSAANQAANSRTYKGPNSDMIAKSCSLLEQEKKGVRNYKMEHNFNGLSLDSSGKLTKFGSSGKVEMNHQGGSQLHISTENMIQPVKFQSNETLQNRSLGVSKKFISNISRQIIARTNPNKTISQPIFRTRKMNDGKRIHRGTSSTSGIPFSSPPRTSRMFSPTHQGPTWIHDFPKPSARNTIACPIQVSQSTHIPITHVPIPPSAITKTTAEITHIPVTHAFSNPRRRPKVEKQENLTHINELAIATNLQVNTRDVDSLDPNGMPKHSENVDQDSSSCTPSPTIADSDSDLEHQKS